MPAEKEGIGGALRRRPFRRAVSTPYERPPTALRGAKGGGHLAEGGGLISKIVDPASRLIASGASRLFSSVFRKRLTAPIRTSEEDHQSREDVSHVPCSVLSPEKQNCDRNGDKETNNSGNGGIADLEQLLKQKTFTRVEFDHLAGLLRSRTVETLKADHEDSNEKMEEATVSAQDGRLGSSKVHESLPVIDHGLTIHKQIPHYEEAASPAEIAKAYMGLRPLKASHTVGSFSNQVFQGVANLSTPNTSKRLDLSVAPRSIIRFSGLPDHPQPGSQTERPSSRSAIYRMSRSPYFKVGELSRGRYSCQSPHGTPNAMKSGGRQALKRERSTLDVDCESSGHSRRIRQKSNLMSPSKEARSLLSGRFLPSHSTPLFKDNSRGSLSLQNSLLLEERKYGSAGSQDAKDGNSTINILPSQSSETAQKLLQQLDRLFPSPKDKSSEQKTITRDDSPSKLTLDMLHGSALRSMEVVNSSKFLTTQGNAKLDAAGDSHLPNVGNSHSRKLGVAEGNDPSKTVGSGVKLVFDANGVISTPLLSKEANPGMRSDNIAANSVALPAPKMPFFKMSAPEDPLELDDDDYNGGDISTLFTTAEGDADAKMSTNNNVIRGTVISENPPTISPQSIPITSPMLFRKIEKKATIQPVVTEKNNGFAFPVASDSCTQAQPPPTPTMPTPLLHMPELQMGQKTSPAFSFGSNDAKSSPCVTATAGVIVSKGPRSEPASITSASTTSLQGSILGKSESHETGGDIFKPFENTVSSGISTLSAPAVFAFGASTAPSLSNRSLHSSSPAFSVPGTIALSEGSVSSISNNCTAAATCSSLPTAAATFSTVTSFQSGCGISTAAPVSVFQPVDKSNNAIQLESSVKAAPFSLSCFTSQGATAVFPSTTGSCTSDVASLITISSSVGPSLAPSTSLLNSGVSSSSASASLFPSTAGSSFSALSPAFPTTGSSVFGFTATTQSTGSSPSIDKISSQNCASATIQNCTATTGGTGGSANSSSLFASNSSPSSTAHVFGGNGGSIFGDQSTQSGTGASQFSQNTSQFVSFSSSPTFGLGNHPTGSVGASPFRSASSGDKSSTSSSGFSFSSGTGSSSANSSSSFIPAATASPFGSSSQASISSLFAAAPSSSTSQSTGFSFGSSTSGSSSQPFTFGSSSPSVFPFTSAGTTASSTSSAPAPVFRMANPDSRFGSGTQGNDQMNEDTMTDDTNQAAASSVPTFGQSANPEPTPSSVFGSPAVQPGVPSVFQFGGSQNSSFPPNNPFSQNPSPFQPGANVEFNAGGSFSLGSTGGDKSGRKFFKAKRDKARRK